MIIEIVLSVTFIVCICLLSCLLGLYTGYKYGIGKGKVEGWCEYEDLVFRRTISEPRYNKNKVQKDLLK